MGKQIEECTCKIIGEVRVCASCEASTTPDNTVEVGEPVERVALIQAILPKCAGFGVGNMPRAIAEEFTDTFLSALDRTREARDAPRGENARLREALDGYRAAVSYISADAWDGCWDCIDILKAARVADWGHDWAGDSDRIAAELKRIRRYIPERATLSHGEKG